jgi:hypothetical protein
MGDMPKRDTTADCEGECRDRVKEGEQERQTKVNQEDVEFPDSYPNAPDAKKRKEQPGTKGGHV